MSQLVKLTKAVALLAEAEELLEASYRAICDRQDCDDPDKGEVLSGYHAVRDARQHTQRRLG